MLSAFPVCQVSVGGILCKHLIADFAIVQLGRVRSERSSNSGVYVYRAAALDRAAGSGRAEIIGSGCMRGDRLISARGNCANSIYAGIDGIRALPCER